jgi:hypothetical protein
MSKSGRFIRDFGSKAASEARNAVKTIAHSMVTHPFNRGKAAIETRRQAGGMTERHSSQPGPGFAAVEPADAGAAAIPNGPAGS